MIKYFNLSINLIIIFSLILLSSCENKEKKCGIIKYGIDNEPISYIKCDSSINLIETYNKENENYYTLEYYNFKYEIKEIYKNSINKHLEYIVKYKDKFIFSIDRYPGYVTDSKKEIVKGNTILELRNDDDSLYYKRFIHFLMAHNLCDSISLSIYHYNNIDNKIFFVRDEKIMNVKNNLSFEKKISKLWYVEIILYLNSGRKYKFIREIK